MGAKIKNVDANYTKDLVRLAYDYLDIKRCPGGRPTVNGYMCPFCDADPSMGECYGVEGFVATKNND